MARRYEHPRNRPSQEVRLVRVEDRVPERKPAGGAHQRAEIPRAEAVIGRAFLAREPVVGDPERELPEAQRAADRKPPEAGCGSEAVRSEMHPFERRSNGDRSRAASE